MKKQALLFPKHRRMLRQMGENIRLARLRRQFTMQEVAQRAGISRQTLHNIESGEPSVALGNYFQVLFILGLEKELANVAADDPLGRKLQDIKLLTPNKHPQNE